MAPDNIFLLLHNNLPLSEVHNVGNFWCVKHNHKALISSPLKAMLTVT